MTTKHFSINIQKKYIIGVIVFLISASCVNDDESYIPNVPNFSIELDMTTDLGPGQLLTITPNKSQPEYSDLNYHSSKFRNKTIPWRTYGNGIVLCKEYDNITYKVYDLTCPYKAATEYCSVALKSSDMAENGTCTCCQSEFILYNSAIPKSGSLAQQPLLQYKVSIISFNSRMLISKN
jgi:hypothetical protein